MKTTLIKQSVLAMSMFLLAGTVQAQFVDNGDTLTTDDDFVGINTQSPDALLHLNDGDRQKPVLLIQGGSNTEGDLTWDIGNAFEMGGWDLNKNVFHEQLSVRPDGNLRLENHLEFKSTSEDKISLYGNRIGLTTMFGLGVESGTLYSRSRLKHRWYIGTLADNGASDVMELSGSRLTLTVPVVHSSQTGDKFSLYGARIGQANMYGFGVESGGMYSRSSSRHRWYVGTLADNGSSDVMELTNSRLTLEVPLTCKQQQGDKISLYGKRIGQSSMYGLGVESSHLYFKSNGGYRFYTNSNANGGSASDLSIKSNGRIGIGTDNPSGSVHLKNSNPTMIIQDDANGGGFDGGRIEFRESNPAYGAFMMYDSDKNQMFLGGKNNNANQNILVLNRSALTVGIGTQTINSNYRLMVNGKIRAKEIVVETGWADFVFEDDYELNTLKEVETFIEENGHLPNVPSAKEVEENGVSVGEMESVLLRKVEELTLYMIELSKKNESLQSQLNTLQSK